MGLARSFQGIAYCQRKLGRLPEAEAAYARLLELAPTADSHFLVAQFYEDTQQASKALTHARLAVALSPERYRHAGRQLIDKLLVSHFGCLGIFNTLRDTHSGEP